ncbi:glycoside hydrolase family 127 protein [Roseateles sp. BYS78W]|uniref:Glycoside hydrolase family 127 protein n=1 Tax=Pelomonas candidula TaxID=3299025 RepID=A0ABW7HI42_9BURK
MPHRPAMPVLSRRHLLLAAGGGAASGLASGYSPDRPFTFNIAPFATASSAGATTRDKLAVLNSDFSPPNSRDRSHDVWESVRDTASQWVEYRWDRPVQTDRIEVYWGWDEWDIKLPTSCLLLYWDGKAWQPVRNAQGLGVEINRFNSTTFEPVKTTRLRLKMATLKEKSAGILQWQVWSNGPLPDLPPRVEAGVDRSVIVGGDSYLSGRVVSLIPSQPPQVRWRQISGPGDVFFGDERQPITTARVNRPGEYELELVADGVEAPDGIRSTLRLRAAEPPPSKRLDVVYTTPYQLTSLLWRDRARSLVTSWIPHCIDYCERTDLKDGQGGIDNFVEAAKALRGEPHAPHRGYVFSNAWVHQTVESICLGLMVDAQGDEEMLKAQAQLRATLERWIPTILAAQHPDGYLQTAYTLASRKDWPERWSPEQRGNHEGYVSGYFIEAAINHHTLTGGRDLRLYDAAKRLADCWVANLGPGKRPWFDGHQQMEQALVRFGRFVNDVEGGGRGDAYVALAKFLVESREGGSRYDQSHLPPRQQYEAAGHAVRAVYYYSGMADIAAETGDRDYQSAVLSLWDNLVNRKYYVTGGVGSGDTSEGFGDDYALRHDGYCESCSSCGLVFFQYKLNLAYHHAKYADLYEETLYNALLGGVDLAGKHFTYTNPLVGSQRYAWHTCPCCVGNIPRTLLMMPTWAYAKDTDGLFVNLFVGSRVQVGAVKGTAVEMVQDTNYPWDGGVKLTVNPAQPTEFALRVRMPDRHTSALYTAKPAVSGLRGLKVNGQAVKVDAQDGYAVIHRRWQAGDTVSFELPLPVQRVVADEKVAATRGQVALRRGPLVYSVEAVDQPRLDLPLADSPITARWQLSQQLGVICSLSGYWKDGSKMTAIPYFARMNREPQASPEFPSGDPGFARSRVWLKA